MFFVCQVVWYEGEWCESEGVMQQQLVSMLGERLSTAKLGTDRMDSQTEYGEMNRSVQKNPQEKCRAKGWS